MNIDDDKKCNTNSHTQFATHAVLHDLTQRLKAVVPPLSPAEAHEKEAADRLVAAVREGGRKVIALHFGVTGFRARIRRHDEPNGVCSSWTGCSLHASAGSSLDIQRRIDVAAAVAEALWRRDDFGDTSDIALLIGECMGHGDWRNIMQDPSEWWPTCDDVDIAEPYINDVMELLEGPLWSELVVAAHRIMSDARD